MWYSNTFQRNKVDFDMTPIVLKNWSKLLCFKEVPKISVEEWLEVMKFASCNF